MTGIDWQKLRELEAKATPAPWHEDGTLCGPGGTECDAATADYEDWVTFKSRRADADRALWIATRNLFGPLLDVAEATTRVQDVKRRLGSRSGPIPAVVELDEANASLNAAIDRLAEAVRRNT